MDPALDETSLLPCAAWSPGARISALSSVLASMDKMGVPRVLRSVSDAADRELSQGRGFRSWCFDPGTDRDAGLLVASRLSRQPFIDGPDGLFSRAEGAQVLETRVNGEMVFGLGLGALDGRIVAALAGGGRPDGSSVDVKVVEATADAVVETVVSVFTYVRGEEVDQNASTIKDIVDLTLADGESLLERFEDVFPCLKLGPQALEDIQRLTGSELIYSQLLRHLRDLNHAASAWTGGSDFSPQVPFSRESQATLEHGRYGPLRDFPTPDGFSQERWSLHTKMNGGIGARMYYRPILTGGVKAILIGYVGRHLPCVKFPA